MATRKTAAKTTPAKTPKNTKTWAAVQLPAGFRAITTGDYGEEWDYEEQPLLAGVVEGDVREIEVGKGRDKRLSRVLGVRAEDGRVYTVWESASLKAFFDHVQRGQTVCIAFHGYRDVGRPQPMKVFEGAFTEDDAALIGETNDIPAPKKGRAASASARKTSR